MRGFFIRIVFFFSYWFFSFFSFIFFSLYGHFCSCLSGSSSISILINLPPTPFPYLLSLPASIYFYDTISSSQITLQDDRQQAKFPNFASFSSSSDAYICLYAAWCEITDQVIKIRASKSTLTCRVSRPFPIRRGFPCVCSWSLLVSIGRIPDHPRMKSRWESRLGVPHLLQKVNGRVKARDEQSGRVERQHGQIRLCGMKSDGRRKSLKSSRESRHVARTRHSHELPGHWSSGHGHFLTERLKLATNWELSSLWIRMEFLIPLNWRKSDFQTSWSVFYQLSKR